MQKIGIEQCPNGASVESLPADPSVAGRVVLDQSSPATGCTRSFAEAQEIFQSRHIGIVTESYAEPIRGGTINWLNGPAHSERRRGLMKLVRGSRRAQFLAEIVTPMVADAIDEVRGAGFDLVPFAQRLLTHVAARFIGFGPLSRARCDALLGIVNDVGYAMGLQYSHHPDSQVALRRAADGAAIVVAESLNETDRANLAKAAAAKQRFISDYYEPALRSHRKAPASAADSSDLMDIIAAGEVPAFAADPDLAIREALNMLAAAIGTTVQNLAKAFEEIEHWLRERTDCAHLRTDKDFLLRAVMETIRLHPIIPLFIRQALTPFTIAAGRGLEAGQCMVVSMNAAAADALTFGATTAEFDPLREVPAGVKPYGIGFGGGPHKCFGLPLVLGTEGIDGTLVAILEALYAEGARLDPARPPQRASGTSKDHHSSLYVVLGARC